MNERGKTGESPATDFIREIVEADLASGKHDRVVTRFPPEPNGYLHLGHAKSICLNFGLAAQYGGVCHVRFDDTNPETEDEEYVESIQRDVRWLGFDWADKLFFASDYYEQLYAHAEHLIRTGHAYVDSLSEEEIREFRGTVTAPGRPSPYRERDVEENLSLFRRMRAGEFADGAHVLRARADLAASNMKMRDPLLYRIRHASHYRTGDAWCLYPMYDFTHCLSDAIEGITHSLCTLEFENNRAIYDWVLDHAEVANHPRQIEFARLNLTYTVLSKRKLLQLVEERHVDGWDDPRMPTICGIRRRGYTPEAIRAFCDRIGIAKTNSTVDVAWLEDAVRDDLNRRAPRVMAVLDPIKVVIENYPKDRVEELDAPHFPPDVGEPGSRIVPFARELYVERADFAEDPPKGFHRLSPGAEVRLRFAYVIRCERVIRDIVTGEIAELRCSYDPDTLSGKGRRASKRVKGTIHWVSAAHAVPAEVRLYDRLFSDERPDRGKGGPDFRSFLNRSSLEVRAGARVEPSLVGASPGGHYQFERHGYFFTDPELCAPGRLVFNRTVSLRDSWAKSTQDTATPVGEGAQERRPAARRDVVGKPRPAQPSAPKRSEAPRAERTPRLEAKRTRYTRELGLADTDSWLLTERMEVAELFEVAVAVHPANPKGIANWVLNELMRELKDVAVDQLPFGGRELGELVALIDAGTISGKGAKDVFARLMQRGGRPADIVAEGNLGQMGDAAAVSAVVDRVLAAHPDELSRYRAGKASLKGYFVGQVMAATEGKANPRLVNELLDARLPG